MALRKTIGQLASGDLVSFPGAFRTTNGEAPNNKQFSVFVRLSKKSGEDHTTFLWAHYVDSLDTIPGPNGAPDGNSKYVSLPNHFNQEDYGDLDFNGAYKLLKGSVQNLLLFKYLNSTEDDWISSTGYDYDKAAPNKKIPYAQKGAPSFLNGLTDTQTAIKALKPITEDVYFGKDEGDPDTVETFFTLLSQEELEYLHSDRWFARGGRPYFPGLEAAHVSPYLYVLTSENLTKTCPTCSSERLLALNTDLSRKTGYNGKNATVLFRMRLYNDTIVEYNENNKIWYVVETPRNTKNVGYYIQDGKQKVIKSMWVQKDGKLRRYLNKAHT